MYLETFSTFPGLEQQNKTHLHGWFGLKGSLFKVNFNVLIYLHLLMWVLYSSTKFFTLEGFLISQKSLFFFHSLYVKWKDSVHKTCQKQNVMYRKVLINCPIFIMFDIQCNNTFSKWIYSMFVDVSTSCQNTDMYFLHDTHRTLKIMKFFFSLKGLLENTK